MKFRRFGKTDVNVRILGFGGAGIGFRDTSLCDVERLLGDALDSGLNVVTNQNGIIRGRSSMFLHTRLSHPMWFQAVVVTDTQTMHLRDDAFDIIPNPPGRTSPDSNEQTP